LSSLSVCLITVSLITSLTMSAFAAAIILHPKLNQSLAVLATTIGRDKVSVQPDTATFAGYQRSCILELTRHLGISTNTVSGKTTIMVIQTQRPYRDRRQVRRTQQRSWNGSKGYVEAEANYLVARGLTTTLNSLETIPTCRVHPNCHQAGSTASVSLVYQH
jgi:hypothetical protein